MMAKKKKSKPKLHSMRALEAQGIPHEVFTYPPRHHSAAEVAELAGVSPAQVYKTLVVQREHGKPLLVMIAADRQLSLKRLAAAIGEKKLRMASPTGSGAADRTPGRWYLGISLTRSRI